MPVLECSRCNDLYYSAHAATEQSCDTCGSNGWRVFEDEVSFARVADLPRTVQAGDHCALLYTDEEAAVGFCLSYLRDGLERGERPIIAVPTHFRTALITRLGAAAMADAIVFEADHLYGPDFDPETTALHYDQIVKRLDEPARILSGPEGTSASQIHPDTFTRYERVTHELINDLSATGLCVYDGNRLPIAFQPIAIEGHPLISRNGDELCRNADFSYSTA